jgi:hypothetical protein
MGIGLKVNVEKTDLTLLSHHQNAGQNHDIKSTNTFFKKCGIVQISGNDSNK